MSAPAPTSVRDALEARRGEIVALTADLVCSESPTDDPAGVGAVQERLAEALRTAGAEVVLAPLAGHGPVLEARLRLGEGAHVLLLGHADTVWPAGTTATWPWTEHADGRLSGPGVGDMKACLAVATAVVGALARTSPPGVGAVTLLVVPDEETGSVASRPLIERAARLADACLTLEAARPGGGVVTSRGAVGAMVVRATGHARHVTDEGPRASALRPLARLVDELEALDGASVGILRAGTARQVVPGEGELHVDLRAPTSAAAQDLSERVRALAAGATEPGVEVTVEGGVTRPAWARTHGTVALLDAAGRAARALGLDLVEVAERGGSDASFPGALGVPTLDGLGPPCSGSCSREETVDAADLAPWGAVLHAVVAAVPTLASAPDGPGAPPS